MKRIDRIKLDFTRNWRLPGKERLSGWLKPSPQLKAKLKNGIVWVRDEDIAINTNADNYIEWSILSTGTYEDAIGKLIRISLSPGAVALDIGANIGLQSIRMSQAIGNEGMVYAFEPLTHLQRKFNNNIILNKISNVLLLPYALSDTERSADFMINKNSWNQGTFSISGKTPGDEMEHVTIKIADNIPEIKNLQRLDLVKIDVEGFEYHVLRGLEQTILKFKPRLIFDYGINHWRKNSERIEECFNFLQLFNYKLYQVTPVGCEYIKQAHDIKSGDIFCLQ